MTVRDLAGWVAWAERRVKDDLDVVLPILGPEGVGKSTFAYKLARKLDQSFDAERMQFAGPLYVRQMRGLGRGKAGVWDELTEGGLAIEAVSKENREVLKFLVTCRALNEFHFLCIPTMDLLAKYARDWRASWYADVTHRGRVEFHEGTRTSRRPGSKVFWHKRFWATFDAVSGPDWEAYLRRKAEWVGTGRDADLAVEVHDSRESDAKARAALAGALKWVPGVVRRGGS